MLIRHSNDGKWVLPGGVVEPDEHPAQRVVAVIDDFGAQFVVPGFVAVDLA